VLHCRHLNKWSLPIAKFECLCKMQWHSTVCAGEQQGSCVLHVASGVQQVSSMREHRLLCYCVAMFSTSYFHFSFCSLFLCLSLCCFEWLLLKSRIECLEGEVNCFCLMPPEERWSTDTLKLNSSENYSPRSKTNFRITTLLELSDEDKVWLEA
jgi:hypothetical protein